MADSVENPQPILDVIRHEMGKLSAQLVQEVCRDVRACLEGKEPDSGPPSRTPSRTPSHCRLPPHPHQLVPVDGDRSGDRSSDSAAYRQRESSVATSSCGTDEAPKPPSGSPRPSGGSDWLYRPGKAFAPARILKRMGEEEAAQQVSSYEGLVKLKRRFSGASMSQPLWDNSAKRMVKDLSQHSSLRSAALPGLPDLPTAPAPELDLDTKASETQETDAQDVAAMPTIQAFQGKAMLSPGRSSMSQVFSFQRSSDNEGRARGRFLQRAAWYVVSNMFFESASMIMLCANSIAIGVQTDYMASNMVSAVPPGLRTLDIVFCVFFAIELSMRITAFGRQFFTMTGCGWNIMDLILVSAQVSEEILLAIAEAGSGSQNLQYNTEMMRVVRILRAIKVVRLVGAVRFAQDLQLLINCLFLSLKQFLWSALLLLLAIYVVAIYITQAATAYRLENVEGLHLQAMTKWWGSMPQSVLSLFQGVAGGVDWHQIADPLIIGISPWFGLFFIVFMAFCILALLNVITGTFVETMSQQAKDLKLRNRVLQARRLFVEIDLDGSGFISPEEIVDHTTNRAVQEFFESIDVHPSEAQRLLEVIDIDGNGKINFEEFLEASMRLNGAARSSDLILLAREMKRFHASQLRSLNDLKAMIASFSSSLSLS